MTGVLSRVSRWLVRREPLWLITGAGMVVDVLSYALPVVPDSWHGYVNAALVVAGVVSGRALVTPVRKFATGGLITGPVLTKAPGPSGYVLPCNARVVAGSIPTTGSKHVDAGGRVEPTTGPQTPSGASGTNSP